MGLNEGWIGLSDTGVSRRRMISGLLLRAKGQGCTMCTILGEWIVWKKSRGLLFLGRFSKDSQGVVRNGIDA
ncbi:hypothetical protein EYC80_007233 [Monilinia laxa]|uniref:Uncharacterized protein n=1 Tax=Monilinia laxa TaxID=61186 RepID=A0A5N6K0Z5_MONLA|nr:hypothetical protein EYC80_007233 [Monilinia laxa]